MWVWGPDEKARNMCVQAHVDALAQDWGPIVLPAWLQGLARARPRAERVARGRSLVGRDVAASLAVLAAGLVVVANMHGWGWPWIAGDRASVGTLALLGVAAYLVRPASAEPAGPLTNLLVAVGFGAMVLAGVGLAIGTHLALTLLLASLVLISAVLTVRHQLSRRSLAATQQPRPS